MTAVEPVTIVGTLVDAAVGVLCTVRGEWMIHAKFGRQFKVESYAPRTPRTPEGIVRYLASGAVKGIGPVMAERIVAHFGGETFDVMEKRIERLREVPGIGGKRLAEISVSWNAQSGVRDAMVFLQGNGIGAALASKIVAAYGARAVSMIRSNPYRLAWEMSGVGFLTADRIAASLGFPRDAPERTEAGVLHVMDRSTEEGHVFLPLPVLLHRSAEILGGEGGVRGAVEHLDDVGRLVVERDGPVVGEGDPAAYQPRLHAAEVGAAEKLARLAAGGGQAGGDRAGARDEVAAEATSAAADAAAALGLKLAPSQLEAVVTAMQRRVTVITGGPGTGKTTIIRVLVRLSEKEGRTTLLAAPTGRAAKRMSEATGREAKTIHRLLEIDPATGRFRKNEREPLDCDTLVLDEVSMIDILLMDALLSAVPSDCRLILVGDSDQLPSVGPGNVLTDVIRSERLPVVLLSEVFRQAQGSSIVSGAHAIIRGVEPDFNGRDGGDFYFIEQEDPKKVAALLVALCRERIPARFGLDPFEDIQVLSPMNRGEAGTVALNAVLQESLNPRAEAGNGAVPPEDRVGAEGPTEDLREPAAGAGKVRFFVGDKVMQTRNDYERDVYNGDIGRVIRVDNEHAELDVLVDGRSVRYQRRNLDDLALAYAMSVHKAQGSEFPAVVLPLLTQHYLLLQRNLLYTAVTRGKQLVVIVGTRKALSLAIRNNRTQVRHTGLAQRLRSFQFTQI